MFGTTPSMQKNSDINWQLEDQVRKIPIINAIVDDKLEMLQKLIADGSDVNFPIPGGDKRPLHISVECKNKMASVLLIAANANVNALTKSGFSPLHVAGKLGDTKHIEMLIQAGAKIDVFSEGGCTPLHEAAAGGYTEAVLKLLELGANHTLRDLRLNLTAADLAGINGHKSVRDLLLEYRRSYEQAFILGVKSIFVEWIKGFSETSLEYQFILKLQKAIKSSEDGDLVFVTVKSALEAPDYQPVKVTLSPIRQQLIEKMKKYNQDKLNTLKSPAPEKSAESKNATQELTRKFFIAITNGNIKEAMDCIFNKVDVNNKIVLSANTPHYTSVHISDASLKIIQPGTSSPGESPLYLATSTGNPAMVTLLLKEGAKPDTVENNGLTALMLACQRKYKEIVSLLLAHGAPVNNETFDGSTALCFAAEADDIDIIELLISYKADVSHSDEDGETPLLIATGRGHINSVTTLLHHGAPVNKAKPNGVDASFIAAQTGQLSILKLLVKYGATLHHTRKTDELSLLQISAAMGHEGIVNYLIQQGVDIHHCSKDEKTAYDYAVMANQTAIALLLKVK